MSSAVLYDRQIWGRGLKALRWDRKVFKYQETQKTVSRNLSVTLSFSHRQAEALLNEGGSEDKPGADRLASRLIRLFSPIEGSWRRQSSAFLLSATIDPLKLLTQLSSSISRPLPGEMMQKLRDYIRTAIQILGPRLFPQVAQVFMGASDLLSDPTAQLMTWFNTFRLCSFCPSISTRLWIFSHLTRTTGAAGYGDGSALLDEIHWTPYVLYCPYLLCSSVFISTFSSPWGYFSIFFRTPATIFNLALSSSSRDDSFGRIPSFQSPHV